LKSKKILFLCTGNSCRSQIAEAIARNTFDDSCYIESAGTENHGVNPNAVRTLKEIGIDISNYKSKTIELSHLSKFNLVITLCGDARDKCSILNQGVKHIHWNLKDPAKFKGNDLEIISNFQNIRDLIASKVKELKIKLEEGLL
tara:strand:+ start:148 stop:579 length:432 start_codon:yes stop_codon:yes gene_type:complete